MALPSVAYEPLRDDHIVGIPTKGEQDEGTVTHELIKRWNLQSLRRSGGWWYTCTISLIALLGISGWGYAFQQTRHHETGNEMVFLGNCGTSVEEALANGCTFDLMMYNWVKPACYPKDLSNKFIEKGNWTFYADQQATQPISYDVVYGGEASQVWVRGDFHHSHCAYILTKRLQAENQGPVILDSKTRSVKHTEHCIAWVGKPKESVFDLVTLNLTSSIIHCVAGKL